jgi:hypothetical protein
MDANGQIEFTDVVPGRYEIEVSCSGGYVSALTSGAVDLLSRHTMEIEADSEPPSIEITVKQDAGGINGKMEIENRPSEITVLLVPEFPHSIGPLTMPVSSTGEFQFENLAPGEYVAYAVRQIDNLEYKNADALTALTGGERVQVGSNARARLTLRSLAQ